MGIFYNPPPPFTGGRQPLEAKKLIAAVLTVAAAAADVPPGNATPKIVTIEDAQLPQRGARFSPALFEAQASGDTVTHSRFGVSIVSRWWVPPDPLPTLGGKLNPSITAVAVDQAPGVGTAKIVSVDDFVLPQVNRKLPQGVVVTADNPPFGLRRFHTWSWGAAAVTEISGGGLIESVDPPPGLVSGAYSHAYHVI